MTRSEYKKAGVVPPPASSATHPGNHKPHAVSPKPTNPKTPKTASPPQTPKIAINKQVGAQILQPKPGPKIKVLVATDTILNTADPGHQPGSVVVCHMAANPKQTGAKTFASVASTPKTPTLAPPQQASAKVQTPTKPLQAKTDTKKTSPIKGQQQSKKGPNQCKGKGNSKPKAVTVDQKTFNVNNQTVAKAKQADRSDSPTMKKPFDKVPKPIKTTERIVQIPGKREEVRHSQERTMSCHWKLSLPTNRRVQTSHKDLRSRRQSPKQSNQMPLCQEQQQIK